MDVRLWKTSSMSTNMKDIQSQTSLTSWGLLTSTWAQVASFSFTMQRCFLVLQLLCSDFSWGSKVKVYHHHLSTALIGVFFFVLFLLYNRIKSFASITSSIWTKLQDRQSICLPHLHPCICASWSHLADSAHVEPATQAQNTDAWSNIPRMSLYKISTFKKIDFQSRRRKQYVLHHFGGLFWFHPTDRWLADA